MKTDNIWICESVGKLKGIGNQGEEKNEWDKHSHHLWFTKTCLIVWVDQATNIRLRLNLWNWIGISTKETDAFHQRPQESKKSALLQIWRYMGREVKAVLLHVKIVMHQWSDTVDYEGIRETDEWVCECEWG